MAATMQQLFAQIAARTTEGAPRHPTVVEAVDALVALDHAGRALHLLAAVGLDYEADGPLEQLTMRLSSACRNPAQYPGLVSGGGGQLTDRMGAAADLAGTAALQLGRAERWAMTVEFATAADRCAVLAQRLLPHQGAQELTEVHRFAALVERAAAGSPPTALARAALDRLIPTTELRPAWAGTQVAAEAAAALVAAIGRAEDRGGLTLREMRTVTATAEVISSYAAAVVAALPPDKYEKPWRSTAVAWYVVRASTQKFDDGRSTRDIGQTDVVTAAQLIRVAIRHDLGPVTDLDRPALSARPDRPLVLDDLRQVTNQTSVLAEQLAKVAHRWAGDGTLHAAAADLPPMDKMPPVRIRKIIAGERIRATGSDLYDVRKAIHRAGVLSIGLADALNRTPDAAPPTQPNLAALYASRVNTPRAGEQLLAAAQDAERAITAARTPFHVTGSPRPEGPAPGR